MNSHFEKYDNLRRIVELETNSSVIKPVSFEVFKKTREEKLELKTEKLKHKRSLMTHYGKNYKRYINIAG